jgi:hypothetical protein
MKKLFSYHKWQETIVIPGRGWRFGRKALTLCFFNRFLVTVYFPNKEDGFSISL